MADDSTPKPATGPRVTMVPEGDNMAREVCPDCGFVNYRNPLVVVGAVATWQDRILLCRRAIPPRNGYWTIPAGYLELNESTADGARREAWEEARADLDLGHVLGIYNIPRISQVQVIYAAKLVTPDVAAGEESLEVRLFAWDEIPWPDIAFPSVHWALGHHREAVAAGDRITRANPAGETGAY